MKQNQKKSARAGAKPSKFPPRYLNLQSFMVLLKTKRQQKIADNQNSRWHYQIADNTHVIVLLVLQCSFETQTNLQLCSPSGQSGHQKSFLTTGLPPLKLSLNSGVDPEAAGRMQDSLISPFMWLCHSSFGSAGTNTLIICRWVLVSPFRRASGGGRLHLRIARPRWHTSVWHVKCPLSKPVKYLKTSEQECSCYLRRSERSAEGGFTYSSLLWAFISWNNYSDVLNDRWTKRYRTLHIFLLWKMIHF